MSTIENTHDAPPGAKSDPGTSSRRSLWRRNRALFVLVGLVAAGLALLVVAGPRDTAHVDALEPANPNPDGAKALARVLEGHGIRVTVARGDAELASAEVGEDTTVFVTSTDELSSYTSGRLRTLAADAGTLVLAGASPTTVDELRLGVDASPAFAPDPVPASCDDPLLAGLEVVVPPTTGYVARRSNDSAGTCFPVGAGRSSAGLVTSLGGRPSTYLVGAVELFANGQITEGDDAAVALRLLGRHRHLVWYVADTADVPPGDAGPLSAILPPWLGLASVAVGLALLAMMFWRGRRLGPLVVEPLPVTVKAVESTVGRGRLYSRARDRDHAARNLRDATAVRLAEHLSLPRGTGLDQLVPVVAMRIGRPTAEIRGLLEPRPVPDDAALTLLAQQLTELEREVRQP